MMTLHDRIVSELTQLDERKRERDRSWNPHFLGIALIALEGFDTCLANGITAEDAFIDRFTPSREMHTVARKVGLRLDVDHGNWIAT